MRHDDGHTMHGWVGAPGLVLATRAGIATNTVVSQTYPILTYGQLEYARGEGWPCRVRVAKAMGCNWRTKDS